MFLIGFLVLYAWCGALLRSVVNVVACSARSFLSCFKSLRFSCSLRLYINCNRLGSASVDAYARY